MSEALQTTSNAFLADHVIGGNKVLPTVCAISWMVNAAESAYSGYQYQGLGNYKLFKGIVFEQGEDTSKANMSQQYVTELKLLPSSDEKSYLRVAAKISSVNSKGKPVFHYAAELILSSKPLPDKTFMGDLPLLSESQTVSPEAQALYQDGTLFHGESLQGIKAILQCNERGLLLACRVAESALLKQGEFEIGRTNIFADDLVYQAMLVWVRQQLGLGSLPSATKAWTVYRSIKADETFYLKLDVLSQKANVLVADIVLISADKKILAEIKSAEVTASSSLNELFKHD